MTVRPLSKRQMLLYIGAILLIILAVASAIIYANDNHFGLSLFFGFVSLLLFAGFTIILMSKVEIGNKRIAFPKIHLLVTKLKDETVDGYGYDTVLARSDEIYATSVEYKDLLSVELRNKNNQEKRKYDVENETESIDFIDNKGRSFRLKSNSFSKKQITKIISETKKRITN